MDGLNPSAGAGRRPGLRRLRCPRRGAAAALIWALLAPGASADQPPPDRVPVPDPPPIPRPVRSGESLEPDVTITRGSGRTVTEYRINGRLEAIKVEPDDAPAYFLIDTDGDGNLETRRNALSEDMVIPHWIILSW